MLLAHHLLKHHKCLYGKYLRQVRPAALALSPYRARLCVSRGVNEHLFTYCTGGHRYDPFLSATIFPHHPIDKAHMSVTLWVEHAVILTVPHGRENLVKVIRYRLIGCCKHVFSFLSCFSIIQYRLVGCQY